MSNEIDITAVRQKTIFDRDRGHFKVKEVTFYIGKTRHTLDISMSDFDAGRMEELVMADAERIKKVLGKKK